MFHVSVSVIGSVAFALKGHRDRRPCVFEVLA